MPGFQYEYTDARLANFVEVDDHAISLQFDLSPELYPANPRVEVQFHGVPHADRFFSWLLEQFSAADNSGVAVKSLQYKQRSPNENRMPVLVSLAGFQMYVVYVENVFEAEVERVEREKTVQQECQASPIPSLPVISLKYDYAGARLAEYEAADDCNVVLKFDLESDTDAPTRVHLWLQSIRRRENFLLWLRARCGTRDWKTPPVCQALRVSQITDYIRVVLWFNQNRQYTLYVGNFFEAAVEQPEVGRVERVAPEHHLATLASSHVCHQCHRPLRDSATGELLAIDRDKATVDCPACGNRTSVYAVRHCCPSCGTLLESPTSAGGRSYTCPACGHAGTTPYNLLSDLDDVTVDADASFVVPSPACDARWAAPIDKVDVLTACRRCFAAFAIPRHGEHLEFERDSHPQPVMRCPDCRQLVPISTRAARCAKRIFRSATDGGCILERRPPGGRLALWNPAVSLCYNS